MNWRYWPWECGEEFGVGDGQLPYEGALFYICARWRWHKGQHSWG